MAFESASAATSRLWPIMAVAAFAQANQDRLVELDVNPLLVLPEGQGAIAVDALVRLVGDPC